MQSRVLSSPTFRSTKTLILDCETVIFRTVLCSLTLTVWAVFFVIGICIHTINQCDTKPKSRRRRGRENRFLFLERGCRNFLPTLGRIFGFVILKRLIMNPEHTSHIYRPRDGFTKTSNPRKPVPYCCRNSHTKKMPFWCFSNFMNIRLIVH